MERITTSVRMFLAGVSIGIASLAYLKVGGVVGALMFSFGLILVVKNDYILFTGKAGFMVDYRFLLKTLLFNIIGCALLGFLGKTGDMNSVAVARLQTPVLKTFALAIGCGFIMTNAVYYAKRGEWLPLLFGVPVFIFCGFPHCVADVAYYVSLPSWYFWRNVWKISATYVATVLGNGIGCKIPTFIGGLGMTKPEDE